MKFLLVTLLLSAQVFAMSKSEFSKKIERNEIAFDQAPILNMDGKVLERYVEVTKAKYPNFKPQMAYYHSVKIGDVLHMVLYDYTSDQCIMTKIDISKSANEIKKSFSQGSDGSIVDANREILELKICEKLYNFYKK